MITAYEPIGKRTVAIAEDYVTARCPGRRMVTRVERAEENSLRTEDPREYLGRNLDVDA